MQEKRKDQRIKDNFIILCRIYERTDLEVDLSKIVDISKSGLCFLTSASITSQHLLELTFRFPPDFKEKIQLYGRVIDSQKESDTEYKTRVVFIDTPQASKAALEKFIEQTRQSESQKKQ